MKVYLIKASAPGPFKEYKKYMGSPPQNIFAAAAATPPHIEVDMCDETMDMKPNLDTDADVVAIFFHTPDAIHTYKLADEYRKRGKFVVFGGLHATFMPDEACFHSNTLLLGEIEGIWLEFLHDFANDQVQARYERTTPVDMATLKPYPTNIIKPSKYFDIWSVLVTRGCVNHCEYCVIPPFFKGKFRVRPIKDVIAEIKAMPTKWVELHADNLTANRDYAVELFKELAKLDISWIGESTITMANDPELLQLAQESGCRELLIGIETPSQAALRQTGKKFVNPDEIKDCIDRFHDHGILITSSMVFGFDSHTPDIFQESYDFSRHIGIDEVASVILCPFAGTPLFRRLDSEHRILTWDWSKYDCSHAVFEPLRMTPDELEEGAHWFYEKTSDLTIMSPFSYGMASISSWFSSLVQ